MITLLRRPGARGVLRVQYWPRCCVYVMLWKRGFQVDVQRDQRRDAAGNYSFRGHLWTWDYREPHKLRRC